MRKRLLFVLYLSLCLALLCGCNAAEMGSLSDFSKPYTGVYECKTLRLGDKDMAEKFESVLLELKDDGAFTLSYRTAEGGEGSLGGTYEADTEKGKIAFSAKTALRTVSRSFPFEQGVIYIDLELEGRLLHAEFRMP